MFLCDKLVLEIIWQTRRRKMKNWIKKFELSLLVTLIVLFALISAGFMSLGIGSPLVEDITTEEEIGGRITVGDFKCSFSDGAMRIIGCDSSLGGDIIIPNALGGYPVAEIRYGAFRNCTGLTSVTIPDSVTSIGNAAFEGCTNLKNITIPDSVISIGKDAFYKTSWYNLQPIGDVYAGKVYYRYKGTMPNNTYVSIVEGTKGIGVSAFEDYENLISITIPKSIVCIGNGAFENCTGLTKINWNAEAVNDFDYHNYTFSNAGTESDGIDVVFGDDVKTIPKYALSSKWGYYYISPNIKSIEIGNNVENIGSEALNNCPTLEKLTVSADNPLYHSDGNCVIESENRGLFLGCKKSIIPQDGSVTRIMYRSFSGCTDLKCITIPFGVTIIEDYAFQGCTGLESVNIPDSVISIGSDAFNNCGSLTSVIIPDSVLSIESGAFRDCTSLRKVKIGSGVSEFGWRAFGGCTALTSVYLSYGIASIGESMFIDCTVLKEIIIPDSVTRIESQAFCNTGITKIIIPENVSQISSEAFFGCKNMESIEVSLNNVVYHSKDNCVIKTKEKELVSCCKNSIIPSDGSVEIIGSYAFRSCKELSSLIIPEGIKAIGYGAFESCTKLSEITIPDSVTSVGEYAFHNTAWYNAQPDGDVYVGKVYYKYKGNMPNNANVTIKDGTKGIASGAFKWCTNFNRVEMPNTVTSIGKEAFYDCTNLSSIIFSDNITYIDRQALEDTQWYDSQPDGDIYIGKVYYKYKGVMPEGSEVAIKDGTKSITDSAFEDCTNLTAVTIPDSVSVIGESAFENCSGLTSIIIPNGVKTIGVGAFVECSKLKSIYISESVENIEEAAFALCGNLESITVSAENKYYHSDGNCLIDTKNKVLMTGTNNSVIPTDGSVRDIGIYAFTFCSRLTNITIPESVRYIEAAAFACTGLTEIIIPNSVYKIGEIAFVGTNISKVTIPNSVKLIDQQAFGYKSDENTKVNNFRIYGHAGTAAEFYSDLNEFEFINLDTHTHEYVDEVIKTADCTEEGKIRFTCDCSDSYIKTIPALGHKFVTDIEAKAATCTETGNTCGKHCVRCEYLIVSEVIPATGHTEKTIPAKNATCVEPGYTEGAVCSACGILLRKIEIVPALGHDMVTDTGMKVPTCTENGKTESAHCTRCDYKVEAIEISAKGHSEEIIDAKRATCLEPGYTEGIICVVCGKMLVEQKEVPALGHHMILIADAKNATCTEVGYTEMKSCTRCNYKSGGTIIPALGHTEEIISGISVTCTAAGVSDGKKCSVCGEILVEQMVLPAIGHDIVIDVEAKAPTCTESGTTEGKHCPRCDYKVEAEEIEPLGHTDDDHDGKCDHCGENLGIPNPSETCSCACHKKGIVKFFFKIGLIFQKIFKKNRICKCGVWHY